MPSRVRRLYGAVALATALALVPAFAAPASAVDVTAVGVVQGWIQTNCGVGTSYQCDSVGFAEGLGGLDGQCLKLHAATDDGVEFDAASYCSLTVYLLTDATTSLGICLANGTGTLYFTNPRFPALDVTMSLSVSTVEDVAVISGSGTAAGGRGVTFNGVADAFCEADSHGYNLSLNGALLYS
jgi:hypothetical protein